MANIYLALAIWFAASLVFAFGYCVGASVATGAQSDD